MSTPWLVAPRSGPAPDAKPLGFGGAMVRCPAGSLMTFRSRLAAWSIRLAIAGALLSALGRLLGYAISPVATGRPLDEIRALALVFAVYAIVGVPLAIAGALLDRFVMHLERLDPPRLVAFVVAVVGGALAIVELDGALARADLEYLDRVALARPIMAMFLVGAVGLLTLLVVLPATRLVLKLAPTLGKPVVTTTAVTLAAAFALWVLSNLALAPMYLFGSAALTEVGALGTTMLAARVARPQFGPRTPRIALGVAAVVLATAVASCHQAHANFTVHDRWLAAGPLAALLRGAVDLDHDGAAPAWLGGADCAEGNPAIGPAQPEIHGDGIDQDCRGGDAPVSAATPAPSAPAPCMPPAGASVLLLTIDALRADAIDEKLTPTLARLREDSIEFTHAYATAPSTIYSLAGIFTGRSLSDLTAGKNPLATSEIDLGRPLAQRLRDAGLRTAAFNFFALPPALLTGFEQERALTWREAEPRGIKQAFGSSQLTNGILSWISGLREQRSFVWGHYPDAHAPYLDTHDRRFEGTATGPSPYEREVSYVDYHLGRLLGTLERAHILDRTIVIVTGDHGEELGQTGRQGHGFSLYEHSIRVPLFVRIPGCAPARQEAPVSLGQIGPSLGALLAVDIPGLPLWAPRPAGALPVVSETLIDKHTFRRAIIGPRDKMIVDVLSGGQVLFDLGADPREERDIYASDHAATAEAEARYQRWLDR